MFDFVAKYENVDFPTAARRLAERAGIRIVEEERSPGEDREIQMRKRLLALHQEATEWFHRMLLSSPDADEARGYLKKRGLTSEVAKRWKIGYAPNEWEALCKWAGEAGYKREEIAQSGLVSMRDAENERGDFYDRFRDRVMFPICNDLGEVIGFSGRVLATEAQAAKYVNSPETSIFKKGDILFGLHKSKRALIDKKSAIVLEGQIDLITAFEAGVENVVAPQGTAFTEKQARTLKRFAEEVVLCFDADLAGRKAVDKSLPALLGLNLGVRVIELPAGEDPDSLIRGQGAAAFVSRVEAARDYFDYRIDSATREPSFATPHGQTDFAKAMAATALLISDKLLRENVAAKVATRLGMMPASFWRLLPKTGEKAAAPEMKPGFLNPTALKEPLNMLALLAVGDPEIRRWISAEPWSGRLMETEGAELLVRVLDSEVSPEEPASLSAFEAGLDDASRTLLGALLRERLPEDRMSAARDCWHAIEKRELLHRREVLQARLKEPDISVGEITEIQKQILDLQNRLTDISRPLSQPGPE